MTNRSQIINSTGVNTIVTIVGIIISIIGIIWGLHATVGLISCIVASLVCLVFFIVLFYKRKMNTDDEIEIDLNAFQNYVNEEIYIPIEVAEALSGTPEQRYPFYEYFIDLIKRKRVDSRFI